VFVLIACTGRTRTLENRSITFRLNFVDNDKVVETAVVNNNKKRETIQNMRHKNVTFVSIKVTKYISIPFGNFYYLWEKSMQPH